VPALEINLFYTWYVSARVGAIFGLVQIETVTFILSRGDFLAFGVSCVKKFTLRGKRKWSPLKEMCKKCLAGKILSLSSRNCVYLLCFFPDQTLF